MSCSDRRPPARRRVLAGLGAAVLLLPGCLRPMLAEGSGGAAIRNRVRLPAFKGRFGYYLDQSLRSRLGVPTRPDYRLDVQTVVAERGLAIAQDNSVTRATLSAEVTWQLWPMDGRPTGPVLSDKLTVESGYSATTSLFATRQVRLHIERRLAREIGERIARTIQARADEVLADT